MVYNGEVFKRLETKHDARIESLPILVELSKLKVPDSEATDYISISEDNAELFSDSVVRMIVDRKIRK